MTSAGPCRSTCVIMARSRSFEFTRSTSMGVGSHIDSDLDLGLDRRIAPGLRQIAVGIVVGHPEPHAPREFGLGEAREAVHVEPQDSARIVQQSLAIFGEARGPSVALENRLAESFFQPLHLHRDGGLGLVDDVGGTGK